MATILYFWKVYVHQFQLAHCRWRYLLTGAVVVFVSFLTTRTGNSGMIFRIKKTLIPPECWTTSVKYLVTATKIFSLVLRKGHEMKLFSYENGLWERITLKTMILWVFLYCFVLFCTALPEYISVKSFHVLKIILHCLSFFGGLYFT